MKYLRTTPGEIPMRAPLRLHTSNPKRSETLLILSIIINPLTDCSQVRNLSIF